MQRRERRDIPLHAARFPVLVAGIRVLAAKQCQREARGVHRAAGEREVLDQR
jgi:hypothetical protein